MFIKQWRIVDRLDYGLPFPPPCQADQVGHNDTKLPIYTKSMNSSGGGEKVSRTFKPSDDNGLFGRTGARAAKLKSMKLQASKWDIFPNITDILV